MGAAALNLNILRIFKFALLLLVSQVAMGALSPPLTGHESALTSVLYLGLENFINAAVVIAVFARLGRIQAAWPYLHAFFVVVLAQLLAAGSLAALSAMAPQNLDLPSDSLLEQALYALWAYSGLTVGRTLRIDAEEKSRARSASDDEITHGGR